MRKIKFFLLVGAAAIAIVAVYFVHSLFQPVDSRGGPGYFTIKSGQGVNEISEQLAAEKFIKSKWVFETYIWLKRVEGDFLAGEHKLSRKMNIQEIVEVLVSGDSLENERKITIIEGWSLDKIADYLETQGLVSRENFFSAVEISRWRGDYDFLKEVPIETVEGFLFPDTYRVFADSEAEAVIRKMLDNFDQKFTTEFRREVAAQNRTVFETVVLASVIEREARSFEDKKMVADVFLKRLAAGIGLQSDATINYITGKQDLRPSLADLKIDSPYNTYKHRGLPPGPISNPGLDALKAAVFPSENEYYYFLTTAEGETIFSRNYQEHQENIRRYLD